MVSISSFKSSSIQHNVDFVNYDPKKQDGDGQNPNLRLQNSSPQTSGWRHGCYVHYLYSLCSKSYRFTHGNVKTFILFWKQKCLLLLDKQKVTTTKLCTYLGAKTQLGAQHQRILISLSRCVSISFNLVTSAADWWLSSLTAAAAGDTCPSLCLFPPPRLSMIIICTKKNIKDYLVNVKGWLLCGQFLWLQEKAAYYIHFTFC